MMDHASQRRRPPRRALKWYKGLSRRKGRQAAGAFLVEGPRAIRQVMQHQPEAILEILGLDDPPGRCCAYRVGRVTESQLRSISPARTPQGVVAVVRLPQETYTEQLPIEVGRRVLLLEHIQDPGNVGTLIRTAAAFDFTGVLLTDQCADPFAPKCVQSTAGTILSVWLRRTPHYLALVESLRQRGYVCVAADVHGDHHPSILSSLSHLVLALGNEAAGLSPDLARMAEARVRIPLSGRAESLNVAICGAICMYLSTAYRKSAAVC